MLVVIVAAVLLTIQIVHRFYHGRIRKSAPWDCGYPMQTPRMQDTAEGFGQPIRQIFEPFYRMKRELPTAFDAQPHYRVTVEDPLWHGLYLPIARATERVSGFIAFLQRGRISMYLFYSFVTLVAMLALTQA